MQQGLVSEALQTASSRRKALLLSSGAVLSLLMTKPTLAVCADQDSAEAGDECRRSELSLDADKQLKYSSVNANRGGQTVQGVPVSVIDDEYYQRTVALSEQMQKYFDMDVYNKQRVPLIKALKADSNVWVSKYARGGSVRKQSARKMYIAVDAIQGHLASSGLAPFPPAKVKTVVAALDATKELLAEGK